MPVFGQVSVINGLREQRNTGTEKRQSKSRAVIKQSPRSSSRDDDVDPPDFNQLKFGLCETLFYFCAEFSTAQYACSLSLNFPNFAVWTDTTLGKISGILLATNSKSFLLLIFGFVVSIGLTSIKRQAQFWGDTRAGALIRTATLPY